MADQAEKNPKTTNPAKNDARKRDQPKPDEDPVGKVYDSHLMRRLGRYLLPYWWQAAVSSVAVTLKSLSDVSGPFLVMVGIDHYFPSGTNSGHAITPTAHGFGAADWLTRHLSADPKQGITQLAGIYLVLQISAYLFEFIQTYLMQWTGQKIMFDLRRFAIAVLEIGVDRPFICLQVGLIAPDERVIAVVVVTASRQHHQFAAQRLDLER